MGTGGIESADHELTTSGTRLKSNIFRTSFKKCLQLIKKAILYVNLYVHI